MSPHKRATGKKNRPRSRNMFICSNPVYSCKISGPKASFFFLQFFLILVHLSYPVTQKIMLRAKNWSPWAMSHRRVWFLGGLPPETFTVTFSQSYTHKKGGQIKVGKLIQFQKPIHDIFKHLLLFLFDTQKKNVISCRAFPHGDHGVVSGVLFH